MLVGPPGVGVRVGVRVRVGVLVTVLVGLLVAVLVGNGVFVRVGSGVSVGIVSFDWQTLSTQTLVRAHQRLLPAHPFAPISPSQRLRCLSQVRSLQQSTL